MTTPEQARALAKRLLKDAEWLDGGAETETVSLEREAARALDDMAGQVEMHRDSSNMTRAVGLEGKLPPV